MNLPNPHRHPATARMAFIFALALTVGVAVGVTHQTNVQTVRSNEAGQQVEQQDLSGSAQGTPDTDPTSDAGQTTQPTESVQGTQSGYQQQPASNSVTAQSAQPVPEVNSQAAALEQARADQTNPESPNYLPPVGGWHTDTTSAQSSSTINFK